LHIFSHEHVGSTDFYYVMVVERKQSNCARPAHFLTDPHSLQLLYQHLETEMMKVQFKKVYYSKFGMEIILYLHAWDSY